MVTIPSTRSLPDRSVRFHPILPDPDCTRRDNDDRCVTIRHRQTPGVVSSRILGQNVVTTAITR